MLKLRYLQAVLGGGKRGYLLEGAVKGAYSSETHFFRYIGYFFIRFPQQGARLVNSQAVYVFVKVLPQLSVDKVGNIVFAQMQHLCHRIKRYGLGEIVSAVIHNAVKHRIFFEICRFKGEMRQHNAH